MSCSKFFLVDCVCVCATCACKNSVSVRTKRHIPYIRSRMLCKTFILFTVRLILIQLKQHQIEGFSILKYFTWRNACTSTHIMRFVCGVFDVSEYIFTLNILQRKFASAPHPHTWVRRLFTTTIQSRGLTDATYLHCEWPCGTRSPKISNEISKNHCRLPGSQ